MAPPILSAAASVSRSLTCAYRRVIRVPAWPSRRETTGRGTRFITA